MKHTRSASRRAPLVLVVILSVAMALFLVACAGDTTTGTTTQTTARVTTLPSMTTAPAAGTGSLPSDGFGPTSPTNMTTANTSIDPSATGPVISPSST